MHDTTGVKSLARGKVLGGDDQPPRRTGFAAYRATVDVEKMKAHADTAELLDKPGLNLWLVLLLQARCRKILWC